MGLSKYLPRAAALAVMLATPAIAGDDPLWPAIAPQLPAAAPLPAYARAPTNDPLWPHIATQSPAAAPLPAYEGGAGSAELTGSVSSAREVSDRWDPPGAPAPSPGGNAPTAAAPPAWSWTGFYLGAHVGGATATTDFADPFGASIFGDTVKSPGFVGGGQVGFNWQLPNSAWVLGVQADISGLVGDGTNTCFAYSGSAINTTCRVRPEATSTLTARVGYALGADGRSLVYLKGGFALVDSRVDMALNNCFGGTACGGLFFGPAITSNSANLSLRGGIVGVGAEYALTPAWSVFAEYDYLDFASGSVTNLGTSTWTAGAVQTGAVAPGSSGVAQNIQEFKLGLNYKLGADPFAPALDAPAGRPYPAAPRDYWLPIPGWGPGWQLETGVRYMYSWGEFQKNLGQTMGSGYPSISSISRLTYNNMQTNSGEFFARLDTPWKFFVKGFFGGGWTGPGQMNDEDFGIPVNGVYIPYSNTTSGKVDGDIGYGAFDVGYDFWQGPTYKAGAFVGYAAFHQIMNAYGCTQVADPRSDCAAFPVSTGVLAITENDTWQGLRVGMSGEAMLTDRFKVSADIAYLPYVNFNGLDSHVLRSVIFPETSGGGFGVQAEGILSYYVTPTLSVGIGGRYWAAWTTNGSDYNATAGAAPTNFRASMEQAGAFIQASYKFGVPATGAARD